MIIATCAGHVRLQVHKHLNPFCSAPSMCGNRLSKYLNYSSILCSFLCLFDQLQFVHSIFIWRIYFNPSWMLLKMLLKQCRLRHLRFFSFFKSRLGTFWVMPLHPLKVTLHCGCNSSSVKLAQMPPSHPHIILKASVIAASSLVRWTTGF